MKTVPVLVTILFITCISGKSVYIHFYLSKTRDIFFLTSKSCSLPFGVFTWAQINLFSKFVEYTKSHQNYACCINTFASLWRRQETLFSNFRFQTWNNHQNVWKIVWCSSINESNLLVCLRQLASCVIMLRGLVP